MIDDYRLQMSRKKFRTQNYFRQEFLTQFINENATFSIFFRIEKTSALLKCRRKTICLFKSERRKVTYDNTTKELQYNNLLIVFINAKIVNKGDRESSHCLTLRLPGHPLN